MPAFIRLLITGLLMLTAQEYLYSQQEKHFRQISADEGLSQSTVLSITQDNQGFMWMATRNGLNRFDGHSFTTFYKDTGSHQLPSGFVKEVFKDSKGFLWIGSSNGLRIYHALSNSFLTPDEHMGFATGIPASAEIWQIYEYPRGCMWLLTLQHGLFVCCPEQRTIQHLHKGNSQLRHNWIRAMASNAQGRMYISTPHEIYELKQDHKSLQVQTPEAITLRNDSTDIGIQDLLFENNNRLWIGLHNNGIAVWDIAKKIRQANICSYPIRTLYRDKDSSIWAGSFGAGLLYYKRGQAVQQFKHRAFSPGSPGSNFIRSLFQDSQGKIWIGSEEEGVSLYNPEIQQIQSFDHKDWRLEPFKNVRAIYAAGHKIYLGSTITQMGVFDTDSQQFEKIQPASSPLQHHYDIVTQLLPWSQEQVLVATYGSGLFVLDKTTRQLHPIKTMLPVQNITRLVPAQDGNIWVCTNKGFFIYHPQTQSFQDWRAKHTALSFLSATYIKTLYEHNDTLWIATDHQGLFVYDIKSRQLIPVATGKKESSLPLAVNDFLPGSNGIWVATYDNGMAYVQAKNGRIGFNIISNKDQQPVLKLLRDNEGKIWQSTNKGLARYDPVYRRYRYFDKRSGTQGQEYYIGAAWKDERGHLWFGGKNGFDCVYPERVTDPSPPFPVFITSLRVQEQELPTDTVVAFKKHITLHHSENFLTISFTSPDYNQATGNQYIYRMQGVDEQWVRSDIRQARYTALPGGDYLFEVSVLGTDGKPSGTPARLWITIQQPFWNTWLFYVLLAVTISVIVYGLYRYRLLQVEAMYRMRNDISRDLHDDIGGTLSSIHILTEVARQKALQNQGNQAAGILEKVNTLALEMVGRMGDTIWAINPANDTPDKLMERLRNQFLAPCSAKGIQLELHFSGNQQAVTADLNKRKQLYMVTKEILNNALKHAQCSQIVMEASYNSRLFQLSVSDNGIGFTDDQSGLGNGLRNLQERISALKGSLHIDSVPGKGTKVLLSIPLP